ncbi:MULTISPECIES: hypothetical protein [unclassified Bradyrhizobium]|uniref:hypothetical protein n=1 Tax=Bradyrhizobium TaxID=374 RepID=UPI002342BD27|nr:MULTISPECIES: hypothetical protein [unclassified Bradyrhizobium]GLH80072.1 hypothetical protein SSBR45G_49810 [Bradyrhizobium sp. SSBR45G]
MLAYAMPLLGSEPVKQVKIHPDGQRAQQIDFRAGSAKRGFGRIATAPTAFAGTFENAEGQRIVIHPQPRMSSVTADAAGETIEAECKGGTVETRHCGRLSRLDKGLCEIGGRLMMKPAGTRQVAIMPQTEVTLRIGRKLAPRCAGAGIRIPLIGRQGDVKDVQPEATIKVVRSSGSAAKIAERLPLWSAFCRDDREQIATSGWTR